MDQQLYNTSNGQGRGTSLDSLFGQFSSAGLGAQQAGLMDQSGRRGGDSILGAPHQEYQPMEGNFGWTDNYSRFAAPHNFTAVETLMSELAPEDHFGGGDPHLTSILQQFLMKQQHQMPAQHGMPPSYIPDDLLMNNTAGVGNKPTGTGAGGNRSRGGSFHVKLENQQQQMAMLEQQQQQQMSHLSQNQHNAAQSGHHQQAQGQQMQQTGHNQGNPGDIYGALELLSAYLGTTPGQFPDTAGPYGGQMAPGSNVAGQPSHLGDPYFDLLNGGASTQGNPYQYMNPYYPDYLNFDPTHQANTMKATGGAGQHGHNGHNTHGAGSNKSGPASAYQQAASHYMNAAAGHQGGPSAGGYAMDQQVQHELLQQLFKEDQQHHPQHQHRQYEDLTGHPQQANQQSQNTAVSQQMNKQQRNTNMPPSAAANGKANQTPMNPSAAVHGHMQPHNAHMQQQMNPSAAGSRMKPETAANMQGNKVAPAATTGKNDKMPSTQGYPPRMGMTGAKPVGGMVINDWADALSSNDYLPESIKSLLPASVRDQLLKKSQEYYEYMRRGPKDPNNGPGMHHAGLPIPASSTHLLQGYAANPRNLLNAAGFPSMPPRRIGQLTAEERRNKIEKYLTKRKKRSWSKKISYDCRKRVADSRLRIKGRFVTKEQAVAVLGADDQMNMTEIKEMLVTKFRVPPVPRRRSSGQQQSDGKAAKNAANDAEKQQFEESLQHPDPEQHDDAAELDPLTGMVYKEHTENGVNATEMRHEELSIGDLDKGQLDSQHFDVLDTSKLIVSVTNNVS